MTRDPVVYVGAVHAPGGAHIGVHAQKLTRREQAHTVRPRFAANDRIATALQDGLYVAHHSGLIFNEQYWNRFSFDCMCTHGLLPAATAVKEAISLTAGKRTVKVAPGAPVLLEQEISPPCSFTIP